MELFNDFLSKIRMLQHEVGSKLVFDGSPRELTSTFLFLGSVAALWLASGLWAAHSALGARRRAGRHFLLGLLAPGIYPLLLSRTFPRKPEEIPESEIVFERVQSAPASTAKGRTISLPQTNRRTIGKREEGPAEEPEEDMEQKLMPFRAYFEGLRERDEKSKRNYRYNIFYSGMKVAADRIVEIKPMSLVVEYTRPESGEVQCVQIPYLKMERCQVSRMKGRR